MAAEQRKLTFSRTVEDVALLGALIAALQKGDSEFIIFEVIGGWEVILLG